MHLYRSTPGEGLAFFPPFLEGHGAFVCDQDLALTVPAHPRFEPQVKWASCFSWSRTQACMFPTLPRRQLLVMWMMQPLWWQQRAVGRQLGLLACMPREQQAPLVGYVMPLALVRGITEAESQLVEQLLFIIVAHAAAMTWPLQRHPRAAPRLAKPLSIPPTSGTRLRGHFSRGHWGGPGLPRPKAGPNLSPACADQTQGDSPPCLPSGARTVCPEGMVGGMNFETPVPEMSIYEKARRSVLTVNQVLEPPWPSRLARPSI